MIPSGALQVNNAMWWPCCVLLLCSLLGRFTTGSLAQEQPLCPSNLTYTGSADATGRATARVLPDQAKVSVTVSSTQRTPTEARASGTTAFDLVANALRSGGINDTGIQTTGFQVEPNYAGDAYYARGQVPSNFTYSQTIEITSEPEELGSYIDAAVETGGRDVRVGSVSFSISRDLAQETLDGLRGIAVANAVKSVTVMIEAAGGSMGTTISITDNSYPPYVPYASPTTSYRDSGALAADAALPTTELFSGLVDVDADVRVKIAICSNPP